MALPLLESGSAQAWSRIRVMLLRYLYLLKRRWWVILLLVSAGLCATAWYAMQQPPAYLSQGRMMVMGQMRVTDSSVAYMEEMMNFFGTQVELMKSADLRTRAHARVQSLHPDLEIDRDVELEVGQLPKASIFVMRAVGKSKEYAQAYLDACMDEYIATKKKMREDQVTSAQATMNDEVVRLEEMLKKHDSDMHEFMKVNSMGYVQANVNTAGEYLAQLNRKLADFKTEYDLLGLLDLEQNLERSQAPAVADTVVPKEGLSGLSGPTQEYQRAKQKIYELKYQQEELRENLGPNHPSDVAVAEEIRRVEALLKIYREQSIESIKHRREGISIQINNLKNVISEWDKKALDLAGRIAEYDKIKSTIERTKSHYDRLKASLGSVDVTKNIQMDLVSILERATTANSVRPGLEKLLAMGGLGGLVLALALLFVIDKFDDRIGTFFEFREKFPENLLGQVPREPGKGAMALLQTNDPRHGLLESFRTLRSSIIFLPIEGARPKTILVTSATPGEGKTTIASNLAIMFAFSGAKTLLVDADLRLGRIGKAFGVDAEVGFSDVMRQRINWREAIIPSSTPNLSILPRGKTLAHPSEHFLGKITDQFLQEVYGEYDYIFFDTPPVMAADDVLSLAPKIDGTIFVVRFATSSARRSRTAVNLLHQRQANVLGLVCNDVKLAESEYGYGSYYQYSSYRDVAATQAAVTEVGVGSKTGSG